MEIHLKLAGVELGPFSERQVREYLTDGFLSLTDPARFDGTDLWEPVSEVLAKMPPAPPVPPPELVLPAPPEPSSPPAVYLPPSIIEPPIPEAPPAVAATPVPTKPAEPSLPSPSPTPPTPSAPQVTGQLIVRSQVKKAAARTSALANKAAMSPPAERPPEPIVASPPPQTVVKAILKKPGPISAPLSSISVLAKDASPLQVPPPSTLEKTPSPQPTITKALIQEPALEKKPEPPLALFAPEKTSLISSPPAAAEKPPTIEARSLPLVVKTQVKKSDRTNKVTLVVPALPENSTLSPEKKIEAKPGEPTSTPSEIAKASKPKIDPASPIHSAPTTALKLPAPSSPIGIPLASAAKEKSPIRPDLKAKAFSFFHSSFDFLRRLPRRYLYMALGGVIFLLLYVGLSHHAAENLRKALSSGDPSSLESTVDFAAVRQSLKEQIQGQLDKSGGASSPVSTMIANSIDVYITPESLSRLVTKADNSTPEATQTPALSADVAAGLLATLNSQPVKSQGLSSPVGFVIDLEIAKLRMSLTATGWKLKRIDLNPNLQLTSLPTVTASVGTSPEANPALSSPVVETYLREGIDKCQKSDWDGAIDDFTKVLAISPKAAVAYSNRAFARQAKGDLDGAIADCTLAIGLDPTLAQAFFSRGNAKSSKNDLGGAIADYSQALNLDPKMAGAYFSRGTARTTNGDYDGAIADYTQVMVLDPNQAKAYSNRGFARQAQNDLEGAVTDYTQALAIDPKMAVAYYNRGLARQAQGNLDAAIQDYNQALDLDPKMSATYYNRGNAKNTKHDIDGAIADYSQALTFDPKMALAYCNRGLARQSKGDLTAALADYTQAVTLDPSIAVAYYNRGLIKEQQDDLDGAITDSTRALDLDPKEIQAYYNRGFAKLTKGDLAGADADLRKFCELVPRDHYSDHARLYLWLIAKAQHTGNADQDLTDSLRVDWNSSPDDLVTKIAGFLLNRVNEADFIATAASSDVKKDQGQHCEAWYFAGMKRLLTGDKATAVDYFRKCLATEEKDYCEYILAKAELLVLDPLIKN